MRKHRCIDKDLRHEVGYKVKTVRTFLDMTLEEMAAKVGVTQPTVSNYERGKYMPTIEFLHKLTAMVNITVDDFLNLSEKDFVEKVYFG